MPIPVIAIAAAAAVAGGGITLKWYYDLPKEKQCEADQAACDMASNMFGKALNALSADQFKRVVDGAKRAIGVG